MKKLILAAVAASLVSGTAMAAPQHRPGPPARHVTVVKKTTVVRQPQYRGWHRGERFDRRQARNYQVIDYHRYRGLKAPPRGYHYVRSGNDAVLVGLTSGIVAAVFANMIR